MRTDPSKVKIRDPFGVTEDPDLPSAAYALDPGEVRAAVKRGLPRLAGDPGTVWVRTIRVTRHKPGKRCVIEYDVRVERPDDRRRKALLIGKIRARRSGNEGYRMLDALWNAGFQRHSSDNISVPEPIGVIPRFKMWLQRKVPGTVSMPLLAGPDGNLLAERIAEAIHKLHESNVPTEREHSMQDELAILHRVIPLVARSQPHLTDRLNRILEASDRLGAGVSTPARCGIHRDFYPAQVIVSGSRIYLIDFDLYCLGDPALDVGNFIAHVTEESLRTWHDPATLGDREQALQNRFLELSNRSSMTAVRAYTILALVRHIYLSTQFPERTPFTAQLVELCEQRLSSAGAL